MDAPEGVTESVEIDSMKSMRTTAAHRRSFERAPRVLANDVVKFVAEDERNPGWFYGVAPDGVEGYFPSSWFVRQASADQIADMAGLLIFRIRKFQAPGWSILGRVVRDAPDGSPGNI